jgi:cell division protease FtsH
VNQFSRNVALWLVLGLMILLLFQLLTKQQTKLQDVSYSDFVAAVDKGEVTDVIEERPLPQQRAVQDLRAQDPDLVKMLRNKDVKIIAKPESAIPGTSAFVQWFRCCSCRRVDLLQRQMQVGGGKAMVREERQDAEREHPEGDVQRRGGVDEAKDELEEIIAFLGIRGSPSWAAAFWACCWSARRAPARRCSPAPSPARRACRSSPSAARLRRDVRRCRRLARARPVRAGEEERALHHLHRRDRRRPPPRRRAGGTTSASDPEQLLVEMDGFETNEASSSSPPQPADVLDPALLRPGRRPPRRGAAPGREGARAS